MFEITYCPHAVDLRHDRCRLCDDIAAGTNRPLTSKPIVRILRGAVVYARERSNGVIHITMSDAEYAADEIERLRKALKKHGGHTYACHGNPCTCGWNDWERLSDETNQRPGEAVDPPPTRSWNPDVI